MNASELLSRTDLFVFFATLLAIMVVGLWVGRKEESSEDYFLAGKSTRWWGVAGSIFGSNVSANHIVGMMGVGFAFGFAQTHFEVSAIFGLLFLCYGFLPVYRKLKVFTLSEYMSRRYDDKCRIAYALIMLMVIVVIQMVPGFYIGSRSLNELIQETPGPIDVTNYRIGIFAMAIVTGAYTIFGGLKAVIITDVIQSVLMLVGGGIVAYMTFSQPEVGGWFGMIEKDAAEPIINQKMHLYNSADHPKLPWTGVLSGLIVLHFYYWGTNQFIVQRALAAKTYREAKLGIVVAGFLKLLIPFMSIGAGVAAFYLFRARGIEAQQDAVFITLLKSMVGPIGFGLVGIVAAGVVGAILSSVDSMLNSGATIITFDFYKKYFKPDASEKELILVGRIVIIVFLILAAFICSVTMDPNSSDSFFLHIASHQSKLIAGVVVAFGLGMFWKRATAQGAFAAIITGVVMSYGLPILYPKVITSGPIFDYFGASLNFMHAVFIAAIVSLIVHVSISLNTKADPEKAKLTWTGLGGHDPQALVTMFKRLAAALGLIVIMALAMVFGDLAPGIAGIVAAGGVFTVFLLSALKTTREAANGSDVSDDGTTNVFLEDRFWSGILCGAAVFMLFYYR